MRLIIEKVPRRRRYLASAIMALLVIGISVTSATARTGRPSHAASRLAIKASDSCGYAGTSTSITAARKDRLFNESTVLKGINAQNYADNSSKVEMFYSDEHSMTLGEATGTAPVTPFVARYSATAGGTNTADDAGTANGANGSGAATAKALQLGAATTDVLERPIIPSLYLTDLGGGTASGPTSPPTTFNGDWQNNGTGHNPQYVAGTWKPYAGPNTSVGDTVANGKFLGPNADAFQTNLNSSLEKFGSEVRWDSSALGGLLPGHWYRAQVIVHDGDQNKAGGDVGEACRNFRVPPANPTGTTTAAVNNGGVLAVDSTTATDHLLAVTTSDTATLSNGTRNAAPDSSSANSGKLIFHLYKKNAAGTGTVACGIDAHGDPVTADPVTTKTTLGTNGPDTGTTGGADNSAGFPNRGEYGSGNVRLTSIGTYFWTVEYTGNNENTSFGQTACGVPAETIQVLKAPSNVDTTPHVKITEDIHINLDLGANASTNVGAGLQAGDKLHITLFQGTCTAANAASGGTQMGNTKTVELTAAQVASGNGIDLGQLTYPDDFTAAATGGSNATPAIVTGDYWWYASFDGNDQLEPANDACTEAFHITLPTFP